MMIGELARRSGSSARSIRHYESKGLLKSLRAANGYREYNQGAVAAVTHIKWLISAGLGTRTICEILPCIVKRRPRVAVCARTREILEREYGRLERQLDGIRKSQRLLKGAMSPRRR